MKRKLLLSIVCITLLPLNAQQIKVDSLERLFKKEKHDTTKVRLLAEMGVAAYSVNIQLAESINDSLVSFAKYTSKRYLLQGYKMRGVFSMIKGEYDLALQHFDSSLAVIKSINRKDLEADIYANYAALNSYRGNEDKAVEFYLKSIETNKEYGGSLKKNIVVYINLAKGANRKNNSRLAIEYLIEALRISDETGEQFHLGYLHNELADNYLELHQYSKAEPHLNRALQIAKEKEDVANLASAYSSLGYLSETRDDSPELALKYYKKSLSNHLKGSSKGDIAQAYYNVGLQHIKLADFDLAQIQSEKGLKITQEIQDYDRETYGFLQLADIHIRKNNRTQAGAFLAKAELRLHKRSAINSRNQFFRIGKSFESVGNHKESVKYIEKYAVLSDSLYEKNGLEKIVEVEERYENEKKENEILQLENENITQKLENEQQQSQLRLFGIGIFLLIAGLGIFYAYYRKNKKQKEVIERLQKELHHRIKNNLAIIDTFIGVTKDKLFDEEGKQRLRELQNRIDSIYEVHQQLYRSNDVTNLNLNKYISSLTYNVRQSFRKDHISIEESISTTSLLSPDQSFPVGLIINEFLTNSFKYAFKPNEQGKVKISFFEKAENYHLQLSDNGKGLERNLDIENLDSFGLSIMKLLSQQLNGTFSLSGNNGVHLNIQFPK